MSWYASQVSKDYFGVMVTFFNENQGQYNPEFTYKTGVDPEKDAWYTTCFIENHIDYYAFPDHVASPEQIRFMVYIEDNERFYPCSDHTFGMIMKQEKTPLLEAEYDKVLRKILQLIEHQIEDKKERDYIKALITIKYKHDTRDGIMIPSRLEKRLFKIYLDRTQIEDPCKVEKEERNRKILTALKSEAFKEAIDFLDDFSSLSHSDNIGALKEQMEFLKLQRLISLSIEDKLWETDRLSRFSFSDYIDLFKRPISGNGYEQLKRFLSVQEGAGTKKFLWLANEAGEIFFDLAIIKHLAQLGHKVIIAVKEGSLFEKITLKDIEEDPSLNAELGDALEIKDKRLSKKRLAVLLKADQNIILVSDGTQETVNLLMVSTTFARIFKEVDAVITKGSEQCRRFFDTHFRFTQDIFNFSKGEDGTVCVRYKPKHPNAVRFSHEELEERAEKIIQQLEDAKNEGMTVIFYSGIIGSIPGKIDLAKKIMSVHIELLKKQYSSTFIINPSEYFIRGMDADDLMYMWERVQRSGLIDIWHFQTYSDIMRAFRAMDMKIPPEWVGKDATFSTGCTKEMNIALEVQKEHPEMQIIGPSKEKFLRRKEYGIGKMYDQRLADICLP
ncbi:MAG: ARMT1-like domain-containing protein [Pseudomonadota bacterium]